MSIIDKRCVRFIRILKLLCKKLFYLYTWVYKSFHLNTIFHKMSFSIALQVKLLPYQTYVSGMIPFPVYIRLKDIQWGGERVKSRRFVIRGDWDLTGRQTIDQYLKEDIYSRTVFQLFAEGKPYTETDQYREMVDLIHKRKYNDWRTRGCRNEDDVAAYFAAVVKTYQEIKMCGYKSQKELGLTNLQDEITVYIDRNGELQKRRGPGHHRLALARLLKIEHVPVIIKGVHLDWALKCHASYGGDILTALARGMGQRDRTPVPKVGQGSCPSVPFVDS